MDNLTHTLTGLMLSRAGLKRFHPRASLLLMISANAPDCDTVSLLAGPGTYFHYHRWITHSLVMVPAVALLAVGITRLASRKESFRWGPAWLLAIIGVVSHLALDFTNPYGIRLFLPFRDSWPVLSITSVVDVWIWLALITAALAPLLARLVSSEIGAKSGSGRGWALAALSFLLLYDCGRAVLHDRAVQVQANRMYNGESPTKSLAYPNSVNPLVWQGIVETGGFFAVQRVDLRYGLSGPSHTYYKPESSPPIEAAAGTELFRLLSGFSRAMHWQTTPANDEAQAGTRVDATDLFFGFTATAIVDRENRVLTTRFQF